MTAALHSPPFQPHPSHPMLSTRRFLQLAGLTAASLMLAACGKKEAPPAPAPVASAPAAAPAKVYVVGTDAAYAPFESQNEKGEIVGFDIEVVQAIAKKAGFEVKFVNTPWEGIFNTLQQGDRDMVVSAVTITDERKQTMDFSAPYFDAQQLIAVRQDSKVAKFADLKKLKVGVQTGTTGDEAVSKLLGKTSTNIKRFESTPLALKELESGGVDAVVADNGVVIHYVANNPGGKFKTVSDKDFVPEQYGIAVKKGNTELLAKINSGLEGIKADGTYDAIYTKYFGAPPAKAAAAASAAAPAASK
jgi:polar amino acid transport system substrate-binding protein